MPPKPSNLRRWSWPVLMTDLTFHSVDPSHPAVYHKLFPFQQKMYWWHHVMVWSLASYSRRCLGRSADHFAGPWSQTERDQNYFPSCKTWAGWISHTSKSQPTCKSLQTNLKRLKCLLFFWHQDWPDQIKCTRLYEKRNKSKITEGKRRTREHHPIENQSVWWGLQYFRSSAASFLHWCHDVIRVLTSKSILSRPYLWQGSFEEYMAGMSATFALAESLGWTIWVIDVACQWATVFNEISANSRISEPLDLHTIFPSPLNLSTFCRFFEYYLKQQAPCCLNQVASACTCEQWHWSS